MSVDEWGSRFEYLKNTRNLYYNDDYLEFLIHRAWQITHPINLIDYGCGYGFLGAKLLPMLPEASTYTGVDQSGELIRQAKQLFAGSPYHTEFIQGDIEDGPIAGTYDVATCHALLLHLTDPERALLTMIDRVAGGGKVICFEPHWIANMSSYELDGVKQSRIVKLGILQKLYEADAERNGNTGNIGSRVPILLSRLGLKDVQCRVSDKVVFLDQNLEPDKKETLYSSLRAEGLGQPPGDALDVIERLKARGLTDDEAHAQYEAEAFFSKAFGPHSWLTYTPGMKISYGTVTR